MEVTDPSGRTWQVERRLVQLPHWRELEPPSFEDYGFADVGFADGDLGGLVAGIVFGIVIAVVIAIVVTLSVVFVFPLIVLIAELVLAGLLLIGRFFLGRWTVVAHTLGERKSWRVRGRAESERFAAQVADALRTGSYLPPQSA